MSPAHYSNAHIYSSCTVFCGHREGVSEMDRGWKSKLVDNVLENARSSDWQQFNFHCNFPLKLRLRLEPSSPGCMTSVLLCPASNWSPLFPGAEKERSNTLPNRTELAHTHTGGHARSVVWPLAPAFDFTLYLTIVWSSNSYCSCDFGMIVFQTYDRAAHVGKLQFRQPRLAQSELPAGLQFWVQVGFPSHLQTPGHKTHNQ